MATRTRTAVGALVVAAGAAGYLGGSLSRGPEAGAFEGGGPRGWPPAPRDMVCVQAEARRLSGGRRELYKVPPERSLVVTDLRFSTAGRLLVNGKPFAIEGAFLQEFHSALGIAFPPGARLEFESPGLPGSAFLVGYLAGP